MSDNNGEGGYKWKDLFPNGLKILVVDDDESCLRLLDVMLKKCEYSGIMGILLI